MSSRSGSRAPGRSRTRCSVSAFAAPACGHVSAVTTRAERLVENETAFRAANDRLSDALDGTSRGPVPFLCECADDTCLERVELDMDAYREVRSNSQRFFKLPGHQEAPGERVVERRPGYEIVEKEAT